MAGKLQTTLNFNMIYISDLAEEFLLKDGQWPKNPNKNEQLTGISGFIAGKQWEKECLAFAGGYVKALEEFTKLLHRYYEISFIQVNAGNRDFVKDLEFAEERIKFLKSLKINPEFDNQNDIHIN